MLWPFPSRHSHLGVLSEVGPWRGHDDRANEPYVAALHDQVDRSSEDVGMIIAATDAVIDGVLPRSRRAALKQPKPSTQLRMIGNGQQPARKPKATAR